MRQQFQRTFNQVRMTPDQVDRVRRALEAGEIQQRPRSGRKKFSALVILAGAAVLLMGAAAVWQGGLFQYFQGPGGRGPADLSQYIQPVQISGTSQNGWTLTVEECMGDDQWAFLWLTLSAPEGTKLPVLGENEHFHMRIRLSRSSEEIRENGGYGTRIQVYDQVPGDNQVQAAFGIQPGIDPEGQIVSITVDQLSYYQNGTEGLQTIQSWSEGITVEDIVLEYPNTVSRIPLELTLPFCDTSAQAVDFKMTPFYFAIDFQMEEPLGQVLEREMFRRMEELPAFDTVKYRTAEREIFSDFEEAALVELHFQDGTVIRPAAFRSCVSENDPYRFQVEWEYRYIYQEGEEGGGCVDGEQTFMINPSQIETIVINGVEIPVSFVPEI